jgi:predicted ATP-binding protein involved in virulence
MKLTRLSLANFRCFDTLEVDLNEQLNVLVAPNGQGKTAILDAIRIALWPYVSAFDVASGATPGTGIHIDDVTTRPTGRAIPFNMEPQLPCIVSAAALVDGKCIEWSRSRWKVSPGSRTTMKDAAPLADIGLTYQHRIRVPSNNDREQPREDPRSTVKLPIIGYYGTGRLWKRRKLKLQHKAKHGSFSRSYAYVGCLHPATDYGSFLDWFFYNFASDFERLSLQARRPGSREAVEVQTPYGEVLSAIADCVDRVMAGSGWTGLRYSVSDYTLVMANPDLGELKVDQLSDGQRSLIAMAGDIAYRCIRLNPQLAARAPLETEGIVLIDEIDMHLHPQWQQTVLANFREAFPKIQLIVTTHSPQVLTSIHKEHIRTLGKNASGTTVASVPLAASYGEQSSDVLESIMLVDPQPPIKERPDLKRLVELVDQGHYAMPEAQALLAQLQGQLRRDHPQLQRVERSIRRQEALKR